ncbi:MAG: non-homologous end-joining DNA ligase [Hyphomicrobiales bacterium]|nr:non-homologous end-joining DNA ligase [Hyphomicrobiales bacterium]MBV8768322.1 non-homologous end-joining DNA ligase [Hyphomicrobiales bacterium]MBV9053322.1 non-homologous end-joining DNA ligase [Hyphomicrobiales bacterium]MBV9976558.1 non-homologous end-joining DNA ligase [Hyphomicrobiales bacterium]
MPTFVPPQLALAVKSPPRGTGWVHELKLDGYRMHARLDHGEVKLLTRTGLDWTDRYATTKEAFGELPVEEAYIDGELCAVGSDGLTSFAEMQAATDHKSAAALVYFAFDLIYLDGQDLRAEPLLTRKSRLEALLHGADPSIRFNEHLAGDGAAVLRAACDLNVEGIVCKRADGAYVAANRGLWVKCKCLNREEFVVVGWTDPKGSRPYFGSLLLGYYTQDGRLLYAGRAGTGMSDRVLASLHEKLQPLAVKRMPLAAPPPRDNRFGAPLELKRVHWVRPELVAEVTYLTWTKEGLLRAVVFQGLREDKRARDVRR